MNYFTKSEIYRYFARKCYMYIFLVIILCISFIQKAKESHHVFSWSISYLSTSSANFLEEYNTYSMHVRKKKIRVHFAHLYNDDFIDTKFCWYTDTYSSWSYQQKKEHLYSSNTAKFQHLRCNISWENVSWKLKNLQMHTPSHTNICSF